METVEFLRRVLPATGLYVIARFTGRGFRHQVCDTLEEAAAYAARFDAAGVPTYHACAAYREREVVTTRPDGEVWRQVRIHKNVRALKCFWMDLDVEPGNDKKFASQEAALIALVDFCQVAALPIPMVVSSGGGIHVYWSLTDEILPEVWKQTAEGLKALAAHYKFHSDGACTSDMARVLRPTGTWNRKDPNNPRAVECIQDARDVETVSFARMVSAALKAASIAAPKEVVHQATSKVEALNQAFAVQHNFPPCSGAKVADRCAQVAKMRDTRGDIPEPHWYAGIQLLCHAVEGDALIHQWSNGHAAYSVEETNRKIAQVRGQQLGPTLCATFESRNSQGCEGCPFKGKISSPAQLGSQVTSAPAPVVEVKADGRTVEVTLPNPPWPFTRGAKGGIYVTEDDIEYKIYEHDAFPTELAYDEQLGFETMRWRHYLPQEGWKECVMQSSLVARPTDFMAKLIDNHIHPLIKGKFLMFGDAYIRKLRSDVKLRKLYKAQGWKEEDTEFVLGDKLYTKAGVCQAGVSAGAERFLAPFRSKGSLATWRDLTWALGHPQFEPHAFMLLLAFACPLLKLAGLHGFTVCAMGTTGIGKSTMAQFLSSVYGHPTAAWCKREDTKLARMQRFGAHNSLPVYMDEATTIDGKDLRDLIYEVPTGAGRDSMRRDYTLRPAAEWATLFITSTNDSLLSKLQLEKQNAEAEGMRLFEFRFPSVPAFGPIADIIPALVAENYGVAGEEYIRRLVENQDAIREHLRTAVINTREEFGMEGKERFWSQAIALTLYGGQLAREWGIIDFDPAAIKPWLQAEVTRMRGEIADSYTNSVTILGEYLNAHIGERLVVTRLNADMTGMNQKPVRELSQRYEKDTNLIFFPRSHIKRWLDKRMFNYNDVKLDLMARGILFSPDCRKILGAGTDYTGGQVPCWKIRSNHPELEAVME